MHVRLSWRCLRLMLQLRLRRWWWRLRVAERSRLWRLQRLMLLPLRLTNCLKLRRCCLRQALRCDGHGDTEGSGKGLRRALRCDGPVWEPAPLLRAMIPPKEPPELLAV